MTESLYQHFIITRFNIVFNEFSEDKSGNKTQTEEWLQKRFDLFDCFCFPSIVNQSSQAFSWLVLFSINTPDRFKEKISAYSAMWPGFIPIYLADNENVKDRLANEISNLLTGQETHLITTRIDNDDSFHKDMIALIQREYAGQDDLYLNFDNGIQYDTTNKVLCKFDYKDNPFISRIEKIDNAFYKTVYEKKHSAHHQQGAIKYIRSNPVWLQIIHDGNLVNTLRLKKILFSTDIVKDFNIKYQVQISKFKSIELFLKYGVNRLTKKIKKLLKI